MLCHAGFSRPVKYWGLSVKFLLIDTNDLRRDVFAFDWVFIGLKFDFQLAEDSRNDDDLFRDAAVDIGRFRVGYFLISS